jgi:hypothetical protein
MGRGFMTKEFWSAQKGLKFVDKKYISRERSKVPFLVVNA